MDILKEFQTKKVYQRRGTFVQVVCFSGEATAPKKPEYEKDDWEEADGKEESVTKIIYTVGNIEQTCNYYQSLKRELERTQKAFEGLQKKETDLLKLMSQIEIALDDKITEPGTYLAGDNCVIIDKDISRAKITPIAIID